MNYLLRNPSYLQECTEKEGKPYPALDILLVCRRSNHSTNLLSHLLTLLQLEPKKRNDALLIYPPQWSYIEFLPFICHTTFLRLSPSRTDISTYVVLKQSYQTRQLLHGGGTQQKETINSIVAVVFEVSRHFSDLWTGSKNIGEEASLVGPNGVTTTGWRHTTTYTALFQIDSPVLVGIVKRFLILADLGWLYVIFSTPARYCNERIK